MKKLIVSISILLTLNFKSDSQPVFTAPLIQATVLIRFVGTTETHEGSGVLIADDSNVYIVTAGHVIPNVNGNPNAPKGYLINSLKESFSKEKDTLDIDFPALINKGNIKIHPGHDIAIIRIGKFVGSKKTYHAEYFTELTRRHVKDYPDLFVSKSLNMKFANVAPNYDVYMSGYPISLKSYPFNQYNFDNPLLRKGIVAGVDKTLQSIIIDCPSYKGNSGGPVYAKDLITGKEGIIGVVSSSILNIENLENNYYQYSNVNVTNSGYSVVVPIDFALELMNSF